MLSGIELYYSDLSDNKNVLLKGEEIHHLKNVMRHKIGDEIYVTNGKGNIIKCVIDNISKDEVNCNIIETYTFHNHLLNIYFCIPKLKNNDRFEFAIEKCVELGITNFIFFSSERTIKQSIKEERIKKLLISSLKQSLRAWLPEINYVKNISDLNNYEGRKILLEQNTNDLLVDFLFKNKDKIINEKTYFIFGPEGGFTEKEINNLNSVNLLRLTENRLRSETAIITTASLIATLIQ